MLFGAPIYDDPAIIDTVERMRGHGVDALGEKEAAILQAKEGGISSQVQYTQELSSSDSIIT
jgi:hypothetical protein